MPRDSTLHTCTNIVNYSCWLLTNLNLFRRESQKRSCISQHAPFQKEAWPCLTDTIHITPMTPCAGLEQRLPCALPHTHSSRIKMVAFTDLVLLFWQARETRAAHHILASRIIARAALKCRAAREASGRY